MSRPEMGLIWFELPNGSVCTIELRRDGFPFSPLSGRCSGISLTWRGRFSRRRAKVPSHTSGSPASRAHSLSTISLLPD
jgi:hypothetical protein